MAKAIFSMSSDLTLFSAKIDTPIGSMIALSDEAHIHALMFSDHRDIDKFMAKIKAEIKEEENAILKHLKKELCEYFKGIRKDFNVPSYAVGTTLQMQVWASLKKLPYGTTKSYEKLAIHIGAKAAVRAVASANARNPLSILVPCHRIIRKDGSTKGYGGGNDRKTWLLAHEQKYRQNTRSCNLC